MRILWITNRPIAAAEKRFDLKATSGTWMEPALNALRSKPDIEIFVATVAACKHTVKFCEEQVTYYCLPASKRVIYPHSSKKNLSLWKEVIEEVNPQLIMVWGTEYAHGYCALKVSKGIPSVIYTQGILDSIDRYYLAGMTSKELRYAVTFRNIIKLDTIRMQQRLYRKKAKIEKEMLQLSNRAIVDTDWMRVWCKRIAPDIKTYSSEISIDKIFSEKKWNVETCEKYTIFTSATNSYPLKGLHILLKAMPLILKKFPNTILRIPAMTNPFNANGLEKFKRTGYTKYLMKLIEDNGIKEHVQFLGRLTSEQMAEEMQNANVFVMPSSIESLSATLREAMTVGVPCVASFVGGIPETAKNGVTALTYTFEEYEELADNISRIFKDNELASCLSANARESMQGRHDPAIKCEILYSIYKRILEEQ